MALAGNGYGGVDGLRMVFGQYMMDAEVGLLAVVRSVAEGIARLPRSRNELVGVADEDASHLVGPDR